MTALPPAVADYLIETIEHQKPGRLLLMSVDSGLADRCRHITDAAIFEHGPTTADDIVDDAQRCDLAIVAGVIEQLAERDGRRLIARLRDVLAAEVVIAIGDPSSSDAYRPGIADFIALGYRRAPASRNLAGGWAIYRHAIHDYKTTPDWLNSRYWANPGRWDKSRW